MFFNLSGTFDLFALPSNAGRTRGPIDATEPLASLPGDLTMTDDAVREWAELLVYRLSGKASELFPAP
jgi:hypothetical protein